MATKSLNLTQFQKDALTGEEKTIELSAEESAYYNQKETQFLAKLSAAEAEAVAKAEAKAELLARLGITAEEAKLLLA